MWFSCCHSVLSFNTNTFAVQVITSTVLLSDTEEQAPSILSTSKVKPGLGSSWKYATDLQLFISKMRSDQVSNSSKRDISRIDSDLFNEDDTTAPALSQSAGIGYGPVRVAEIMRSKRLVSVYSCNNTLRAD